MKILHRRILMMILAVVAAVIVRADPPEYAGVAFDSIQEVTDDATLYFGVIVTLAVLVTGFFLGRKWLKRVG